MITITDASIARGYSSCDHRRHINRVAQATQDRRVGMSPVRFTVRFADGTARDIAP